MTNPMRRRALAGLVVACVVAVGTVACASPNNTAFRVGDWTISEGQVAKTTNLMRQYYQLAAFDSHRGLREQIAEVVRNQKIAQSLGSVELTEESEAKLALLVEASGQAPRQQMSVIETLNYLMVFGLMRDLLAPHGYSLEPLDQEAIYYAFPIPDAAAQDRPKLDLATRAAFTGSFLLVGFETGELPQELARAYEQITEEELSRALNQVWVAPRLGVFVTSPGIHIAPTEWRSSWSVDEPKPEPLLELAEL